MIIVLAAAVLPQIGAVNCITAAPHTATYGNLTANGVTTSGFCGGLFAEGDLIQPGKDIDSTACGETGLKFTLVVNSMGSLSNACRLAMGRFYCTRALPLRRDGDSGPALPCTSEQRDTTIASPATLMQHITATCTAGFIATLQAGGGGLLLGVITATDTALLTNATRAICRVIDDGPNAIPAEQHTEWYPDLWTCPDQLTRKTTADLTDFTDNDIDNIGCAFPCPAPFYTDSQYRFSYACLSYLNIASVIVLGSLVIRWLFSKNRRKYPSVMTLFVLMSILLIHIALLIDVGSGRADKVWCREDGYTTASFDDAACVAQGAMIHLGATMSFGWWTCIIIHMYRMVMHPQLVNELPGMLKFFAVWSIGVPVVSVIIGLSNKQYGYLPGAPLCFIMFNPHGAWQLLLFAVYVWLETAVAVVLAIRMIYTLKTLKVKATAGRSHIDTFTAKVITMLFLILIAILMLSASIIDGILSEDAVTKAVTSWFTCLFTAHSLGGPTDGCSIDHGPSSSLFIAISFYISIVGLLIASVFGVNIQLKAKVTGMFGSLGSTSLHSEPSAVRASGQQPTRELELSKSIKVEGSPATLPVEVDSKPEV